MIRSLRLKGADRVEQTLRSVLMWSKHVRVVRQVAAHYVEDRHRHLNCALLCFCFVSVLFLFCFMVLYGFMN